jgi:hypothetical protein
MIIKTMIIVPLSRTVSGWKGGPDASPLRIKRLKKTRGAAAKAASTPTIDRRIGRCDDGAASDESI